MLILINVGATEHCNDHSKNPQYKADAKLIADAKQAGARMQTAHEQLSTLRDEADRLILQ